MTEAPSDRIIVRRTADDFPIKGLDDLRWNGADPIHITKYWSDEQAPKERHANANLLWSDAALYIRFEAAQSEPLVISETPNLESKTIGLWERDVCEIFIAPNTSAPANYFEFEIAPTGEWVDLSIAYTAGSHEIDTDYNSSMQSAARIEQNKIVMAIRIEWKAFGKKPEPGDIWLGNLLRCVGHDPDRGYLAWQPTLTETPNFHVPEKFGQFVFE